MSKSSHPRRFAVASLSLAVASLLAACGGTEDDARIGPSAAASTLLDDEGNAMPSSATGVPAGLRIATVEQANALEAARGGAVLHASPTCCAARDLGTAAGLVYADQAARSLPDDTPTFVRGDDTAGALLLAERLGAEGLRSVFVVVAG